MSKRGNKKHSRFSVWDWVRVTSKDPDNVCVNGCTGLVIQATRDWLELDVPGFDGGHDGSSEDPCILSRWFLRPSECVKVDRPEGVPNVTPAAAKTALPIDPQERKNLPVGTGVLDYFTSALSEIGKVSKAGNDQHNPGQPLNWTRGKSRDHADTIIRHWMERGTIDTDGMRHSAKMAWRALALLQQELEEAGAPISRGSK